MGIVRSGVANLSRPTTTLQLLVVPNPQAQSPHTVPDAAYSPQNNNGEDRVTSESNRISAASIAYVDSVCRAWGWSWTEMGQADDDGLDGIAYLRTMEVRSDKPDDRRSWKHQFTGGLIHIQVKTGASQVVSQTAQHLEIKIQNLSTKRELWQRSHLPVALVYVKEEPLGRRPAKAWWVDLKAPSSFSSSGTVMVPIKNRFQEGIECRRPFSRLANGQLRRLGLEEIDMAAPGELPGRVDTMSKSQKQAAWDFYRRWKEQGVSSPALGAILVNRTGWSHMTRVARPVPRILTSFELLPAAARIVSTVGNWQVLRTGKSERNYPDGSWAIYDYLGLSALVKWPAREPSEVTVVLRRQTIFTKKTDATDPAGKVRVVDRKTWFYSVYEPGRRKRKI